MDETISMDFVTDDEDVARMLFSPLFICDGVLSQKAFTLARLLLRMYLVKIAQKRILKFC